MADFLQVFTAAGRKLRELIITSSGAPDAGKAGGLGPDGRFHVSLMPLEVLDEEVESIQSDEIIAAGKAVQIYDNAGNKRVRAADRSNGRPATGFIKDAATVGNPVDVYKDGTVIGTWTAGTDYWLGTAGDIVPYTDPATLANGDLIQYMGYAESATELTFERGEPIAVVI